MRYTIYENYLGEWSIKDSKTPHSDVTNRSFYKEETAKVWADELNKEEQIKVIDIPLTIFDTHPTQTIEQLSDYINERICQGTPNNAEWMFSMRESIQAKKVQCMGDIFIQDMQANGGNGLFEDERIKWD